MKIISNYAITSNFNGIRKVNDSKKIAQEVIENPVELSEKAKKLAKKAHSLIEETWTLIRKKEIDMKSPVYTNKTRRGQEYSLYPQYNGADRNLVLKVETPNGYHLVTVDKYSKDFKYEQVIKTEYGSATKTSYNSKTSQKDVQVTTLVNNLLEEFLPKILYQSPVLC